MCLKSIRVVLETQCLMNMPSETKPVSLRIICAYSTRIKKMVFHDTCAITFDDVGLANVYLCDFCFGVLIIFVG